MAYSMNNKLEAKDVYSIEKAYITLFDKQKRQLNKADWFGNGCLYNQAYEGFYLLGDRNADKKIDKQDAYTTSDGSVKFYLFASDAVQIGSLLGWNSLIHDAKLSDVAKASSILG